MYMGKRNIHVWIALAVTASLSAGCSEGAIATSNVPAQLSEESTLPFKMSIMLPSYNPETLSTDGEVYRRVTEKTNTELMINWVPSSSYGDKLSATLASGELPSVITVITPKMSLIVNSVRSGMFWELGPYLQDYPNLQKLNPLILNHTSIDGKVYSIYRERDLAREGVMIRKDWLDNLGLQEPKTVDEFYSVLNAFKNDDPDQNGKNDTIGLVEQQNPASWKHFVTYMGGPNEWGEKEGKLLPSFLFPEYMETLQFYRKLYEEKLMNQDFAVIRDGRQMMSRGKAGVWIANLNDGNGIEENLRKIDPNAKITMLPFLIGPTGEKRTAAGTGFHGLFMIPKKKVKTEEELRQVLHFFDKMSDKDMQNMLHNGIEGRQYTIENGQFKKTTDVKMIAEYGNGDSSQLAVRSDQVDFFGTELQKLRSELWAEMAKVAIANPIAPFISSTQSELGKELDKIIEDARMKFIMGTINEKEFQAAVDKWLEDGGSRVIDEYTAEYVKSMK
jgi:putative aldouronate transport system substrate-binding protein